MIDGPDWMHKLSFAEPMTEPQKQEIEKMIRDRRKYLVARANFARLAAEKWDRHRADDAANKRGA
jgi:hypothetical protein